MKNQTQAKIRRLLSLLYEVQPSRFKHKFYLMLLIDHCLHSQKNQSFPLRFENNRSRILHRPNRANERAQPSIFPLTKKIMNRTQLSRQILQIQRSTTALSLCKRTQSVPKQRQPLTTTLLPQRQHRNVQLQRHKRSQRPKPKMLVTRLASFLHDRTIRELFHVHQSRTRHNHSLHPR